VAFVLISNGSGPNSNYYLRAGRAFLIRPGPPPREPIELWKDFNVMNKKLGPQGVLILLLLALSYSMTALNLTSCSRSSRDGGAASEGRHIPAKSGDHEPLHMAGSPESPDAGLNEGALHLFHPGGEYLFSRAEIYRIPRERVGDFLLIPVTRLLDYAGMDRREDLDFTFRSVNGYERSFSPDSVDKAYFDPHRRAGMIVQPGTNNFILIRDSVHILFGRQILINSERAGPEGGSHK